MCPLKYDTQVVVRSAKRIPPVEDTGDAFVAVAALACHFGREFVSAYAVYPPQNLQSDTTNLHTTKSHLLKAPLPFLEIVLY